MSLRKIKKRLRKWTRKFLAKRGYELRELQPIERNLGYELFRYVRPDGTLDRELYKQIQTEGNKRKIESVWVREENIEFLANYIKDAVGQPKFGLCHGTRRGKEQEWFRKYLGCDVLGTEISETATQFPHTIQWDFHDVKPEWIDAVDFIYSNSLDHSYDPEKCLDAWMSCLKKGGICILEHTSSQERATQLDPFGAHISVMPYLILSWGKGKYFAREIMEAPSKRDIISYVHYIIIQKA